MYIANEKRYDSMKYNRCGNSGLFLPAISLGLWHNFGSVTPYEASREMILKSFDMGITHFDVANNYGPPIGAAEKTLGRILKEDLKPYRDEIIISSKAGYRMWDGPYGVGASKKSLTASLDQSLMRMELDYVDIFYNHCYDPNTPPEETADALAQIVRSGKALYVGVSNYDAEKTARMYDLLAERGVRLLINQPRYSMLNRAAEDGLLDVLGEKGVGAIAFSPLAQGLLTNRYFKGIPADSRAGGSSVFLNEDKITPELVEKAKRLDVIAQSRGQSLAQMALAWVLKDSRMTSVIIGASRFEQISENAAALNNLDFSADELKKIDEIISA